MFGESQNEKSGTKGPGLLNSCDLSSDKNGITFSAKTAASGLSILRNLQSLVKRNLGTAHVPEFKMA